MLSISEILSQELGQKQQYIENVIALMDEGNTIPFIARYRKEMHGAMDDTVLRTLETRLTYLRNLQARREEVKSAIESQGKLTEELAAAIDAAATQAEVEDLYRPYKQKRRTRGSVAREKGLEPLAQAIFAQDGSDPAVLAQSYIDPEKGVETVEDALAGASDIIAEDLSDDPAIRKSLRELMNRRAVLTSKAADPETDSVYRLYYDFSMPISRWTEGKIRRSKASSAAARTNWEAFSWGFKAARHTNAGPSLPGSVMVSFRNSSFSPRFMARIWWPCRRDTGQEKS